MPMLRGQCVQDDMRKEWRDHQKSIRDLYMVERASLRRIKGVLEGNGFTVSKEGIRGFVKRSLSRWQQEIREALNWQERRGGQADSVVVGAQASSDPRVDGGAKRKRFSGEPSWRKR